MSNNLPLYQIIYNAIKEKIESNEYKVDSMIPSEADFGKEYNVSRITVRRALQELELDGLVTRIHGKGTFVNSKKLYSNLIGASSFSKDISKMGGRASSIILDFFETKSNSKVSEYLQIEIGTPIFFLKRLRLKNGRIAGMNETYINKLENLSIRDEDLNENTSIYELYKANGFNIAGATETIEAKIPNKNIRLQLNMKEGEPVFLRERITYLDNKTPIEYSINTYRADEYKYVINLVKEPDTTI